MNGANHGRAARPHDDLARAVRPRGDRPRGRRRADPRRDGGGRGRLRRRHPERAPWRLPALRAQPGPPVGRPPLPSPPRIRLCRTVNPPAANAGDGRRGPRLARCRLPRPGRRRASCPDTRRGTSRPWVRDFAQRQPAFWQGLASVLTALGRGDGSIAGDRGPRRQRPPQAVVPVLAGVGARSASDGPPGSAPGCS